MAHSGAVLVAVAVVAGLAGGAASSLVLARAQQPTAESRAVAVSQAAHVPTSHSPAIRRRPAETAAEPAAALDSDQPPSSAPEPAAAVHPAGFDVQTIGALDQERARGALKAHAAEVRDPGWASKVESSLAEDLQNVASANGFAHLGTDCRATSCVVELSWPTREQALDTYAAAVHHNYPTNCAKSLTLPEEESQPFEAQMIMYCR
jgi:hypothetical protein